MTHRAAFARRARDASHLFLRHERIRKNGKTHTYRVLVRSVRVDGKVASKSFGRGLVARRFTATLLIRRRKFCGTSTTRVQHMAMTRVQSRREAKSGTLHTGAWFEGLDHLDRLVLMAPGSTTHHSDTSARYIELASAAVSSDVRRFEVPSQTVAPRGYYMLFAVTNAGIPAEAIWVRIQ